MTTTHFVLPFPTMGTQIQSLSYDVISPLYDRLRRNLGKVRTIIIAVSPDGVRWVEARLF